MKVLGYQITPEQIAAMEKAMDRGGFKAGDVQAAAERAGVLDDETAMRAADRLIQKKRRAGEIAFVKGRWERA